MTVSPERRLSERCRDLLHESNEVRIRHIQKPLFIPYSRSTELLSEMTALLDHPQTNRMPNLLIVARSNNGKTELLKEFKRRNPAQERTSEDYIYAPVVYVECPPGPNDSMFLEQTLKTLGIDPRNSAGPKDKIEALATQLVKVRTKVLLLDELNSILAGSVTRQLLLLNTLKYISNQTKISIVAAGTEAALHAFATDSQLESRFPVRLMKRWKGADKDFRQLLASFEFVLPLRSESRLPELNTAQLIYGLSEGVLGGVAKLIKDSAIMAIHTGVEGITEEILRKCAGAGKPTQDDINSL